MKHKDRKKGTPPDTGHVTDWGYYMGRRGLPVPKDVGLRTPLGRAWSAGIEDRHELGEKP